MGANEYHFVTEWRVPGTIDEVADVLSEAEALPRWWPAVYLDARVVEPGEESGLGRVVELWTKGWLPYTIRWRFRVTEVARPHHLALRAEGDFVGSGVWSLRQDGPEAVARYDWRIAAEKPLLRRLSRLLRPLFRANHLWAMARGEESLRLELRRRRAATDEERRRVPLPPGPTFPHSRLRRRSARSS